MQRRGWTEEQKKQALALVEGGMTYSEVGAALGLTRTRGSVASAVRWARDRKDHATYRVGKPHQLVHQSGDRANVSPAERLRAERLQAERHGLSTTAQVFGDPVPSRSALGRPLRPGE